MISTQTWGGVRCVRGGGVREAMPKVEGELHKVDGGGMDQGMAQSHWRVMGGLGEHWVWG